MNTEPTPTLVAVAPAAPCSPSATPESDDGWARYIETGNAEELLLCSRRIECEREDLRRQLAAECRSWNALTNELSEMRLENQLLRRGILPENVAEMRAVEDPFPEP